MGCRYGRNTSGGVPFILRPTQSLLDSSVIGEEGVFGNTRILLFYNKNAPMVKFVSLS